MAEDSAEKTSRRVDRAILNAAALDPDERARFLDRLAEHDPEVARQAREGLKRAEQAYNSELFARPAADHLALTPPTHKEAGRSEGSDIPSGAIDILPSSERYELGTILGQGGMGQVVEAFDKQLGRTVALKFLTLSDPALSHMFQAEARSQARVRHDHVLGIYDIGELDGRPFIAMQHVPGENLEQRREQLPLESIVRLLAQAAEGLHAAHRGGLLHHDVKPSNVLVEQNPDGELVAYISDFGVASPAEESSGVAGTPSYMAPERLNGEGIDRRSDIYSFGVTMYHMLTGTVPFKASTPLALMMKITQDEAPSPRVHRPSLPVELDAVIMAAWPRTPIVAIHRPGPWPRICTATSTARSWKLMPPAWPIA